MAKKLTSINAINKKKSAFKKSSGLTATSDKGVKVIFVRLNVEGWRELRKLAAAEDTSIQALMIESINTLLKQRGRPEIAANPLS